MSLLKIDYPGIICCIVGDGPRKQNLWISQNRIGIYTNVEFAGFQDYGSLIGKIKASKSFCTPFIEGGFRDGRNRGICMWNTCNNGKGEV